MSIGAVIAGIVEGVANVGMQIEDTVYKRDLQHKQWAREDSSVQRRVRDLKAAGLSPVLAAGQGAQTGAPVSTAPPQSELMGAGGKAQALVDQQEIISKTKAEQKYIEMQMSKARLDRDVKQRDFDIIKDSNVLYNSTGVAQDWSNLKNLYDENKDNFPKPDKNKTLKENLKLPETPEDKKYMREQRKKIDEKNRKKGFKKATKLRRKFIKKGGKKAKRKAIADTINRSK